MHRHAKVTFAMHRADSRQAGISRKAPMTARARVLRPVRPAAGRLYAGQPLAGFQRPRARRVWRALTRPDDSYAALVLASRAPLAFLTGSALAVAGALIQTLTRNPLADPGLLGVNAARPRPSSRWRWSRAPCQPIRSGPRCPARWRLGRRTGWARADAG